MSKIRFWFPTLRCCSFQNGAIYSRRRWSKGKGCISGMTGRRRCFGEVSWMDRIMMCFLRRQCSITLRLMWLSRLLLRIRKAGRGFIYRTWLLMPHNTSMLSFQTIPSFILRSWTLKNMDGTELTNFLKWFPLLTCKTEKCSWFTRI